MSLNDRQRMRRIIFVSDSDSKRGNTYEFTCSFATRSRAHRWFADTDYSKAVELYRGTLFSHCWHSGFGCNQNVEDQGEFNHTQFFISSRVSALRLVYEGASRSFRL